LEYIFGVKLFATIRIKADSEARARQTLREALDCADASFGKWHGQPITGEVSMDGEPDLYEDLMEEARNEGMLDGG
jgi:hypothetical protein